jgi:23S rRNA (uracil1939-C5)-methyltransferase
MKPTKNTKFTPPFKKGDTLELTVSAMDSDGYGIGIVDNRQIRVSGALPGETLVAKVEHYGERRIIAKKVKSLSPSPLAGPSVCNRSKCCDSCQLIGMDYQSQLLWKHEQVMNQIHCHDSLANVPVLPLLPSPKQLHYRNSAKLVIGGRFLDPVIGMYKRESHEIIDISECPLHHPLINRIIAVVKKGIVKGKIPVYNSRSSQGLLRYLLVRVAEIENRAMVVFVVSKRSYNELHHLASFLCKEVPEVTVVTQNINSSPGNAILGDKDIPISKESSLRASINGIRFMVSPRSFFQVNTGSAGIIYETVRKFAQLSGSELILDLYCGIGAISLFLSKGARSVLGFEVVESAVQDAILNAQINRIENCYFETGDAADLLKLLRDEGTRLDLVVLNPPRKGCDPVVLEQVASLHPQKIIYVSCSPTTLGRDLETLCLSGYQILKIQPVDMFPHTPHIENVVLLCSS